MQTTSPPTVATLIARLAIALVGAGGIAITIVWPAEYGIDPLGTGRALGLLRAAAPAAAEASPAMPAAATSALAPIQNGPLGSYAAAFKYDVFEITLQPYEFVEYKYQLEKGAHMLFSWHAASPVLHDFHAERAATDGAVTEESFDKAERRDANGSFTAPFTGIHGWFWENPGATPVTVRLTSAGFYTSAVEIRSDRSRQARPLRTSGELR